MLIEISNNALSNCSSLEQVVALVNGTPDTDAESHTIAAAYALDACEESTIEEVETHLDLLIEAGAKFDFSAALNRAKEELGTVKIIGRY